MEPNEAAKRALIAYRQLNEMVKDNIGVASAKAHVTSYNKILDTLNQCFEVDPSFSDAVRHLSHLQPGMHDLSFQMESDGRTLLATAHAFLELYLSADDRKKAIGFQAAQE